MKNTKTISKTKALKTLKTGRFRASPRIICTAFSQMLDIIYKKMKKIVAIIDKVVYYQDTKTI